MTKKDYVKIAAVFDNTAVMFPDSVHQSDAVMYEAFMAGVRDQRRLYVNAMADMLASDNPRFGRERFLKACGL